MNNKGKALDIYLMGIGGTGMGAFAGLLKRKGHRVSGSDNAVYSPMREKLAEWEINYRTPYNSENLPENCDLVIVGNVIRRDNPEALKIAEKNFAFDSFPSALNKFFLKDATPVVACGTHGKTTCSSLLAHTLHHAKTDPGFLIGGIPINFGESFRAPDKSGAPFVIEGDEYDTAFFDKRPKFVHYDPHYLLITSLEFDHGDIYKDLNAIISAFAELMRMLTSDRVMVINNDDKNIKEALRLANCRAKIFTYGSHGDYTAHEIKRDRNGARFTVRFHDENLCTLSLPLFGEHNVSNALGCFAILHQYGLSPKEIAAGFASFAGVKRRMEERFVKRDMVMVDDFAHHPSAVKVTIDAARQKYPDHKIVAIFEPRSATSCMKIFEKDYEEAFLSADRVMLAPVGRALPKDSRIDTEEIAKALSKRGVPATAFENYDSLRAEIAGVSPRSVLLFMSNGDFQGMLTTLDELMTIRSE